MTKEQYQRAKELKNLKWKIEAELKIWDTRLISKGCLGYRESSDYFTSVQTNIDESIFEGFRQSAISNLKAQLADIEKIFLAI